jgi:predicted amidohydrolase
MREDLKVVLVQPNLVWENPKANREKLEMLIGKQKGELFVLPEMFTTGFSMKPSSFSESEDGPSLLWMKTMAKEKNAAFVGSLIIEENSNYYNRLFFVYPDGSYKTYDKRHLFTLAGEEKHYARGDESLLVDYKGWKIKPLVCYDLRFPVWARNSEGYDLLLYVANWPEKRSHAWSSLLTARAIENQSYVVGVNRVGEDGNGMAHNGKSVAIDPLGEELLKFKEEEEAAKSVMLSSEDLVQVRDRFRFLQDADDFEII